MTPHLFTSIFAAAQWHAQFLVLAKAAGTATSKKAQPHSSDLFFFLIIVLVGVFLITRSRKARIQNQQALNRRDFEIGDEVTTTSGIFGRVLDFTDDKVELEIAPDVVITILRRAIARVVEPPVSHETDLPSEGGGDGGGVDAVAPIELPNTSLHAPDEHERHENLDQDAEDK